MTKRYSEDIDDKSSKFRDMSVTGKKISIINSMYTKSRTSQIYIN